MAIESMILWWVIVGAAGYLASLTMTQGHGFGTIGNIGVGILGSFFGGAILPRLGFSAGGDVVGEIITATAGAIVLLFLIGAATGALIFLTGLLLRIQASSRP
jgi:uncharacterized membrane protein YeaQ/YmgE (transglycosylase-associated protein family)